MAVPQLATTVAVRQTRTATPGTVAPPTEDRSFRPDIEGLRAVAVVLVVLFHCGVGAFRGGYVGVDVFFVLSGFLITGLLLRERAAGRIASLPRFYARRVRRILPAATLVLVATVVAAYQWLGFLRAGAVARDGQWTAFFAANIGFAQQGTQYLHNLDLPSPLQHYWSLAVEEQFYLVWPWLFLLATRFAGKRQRTALMALLGVIVIGSLGWSIVQTAQDANAAFFSPFTRGWELGLGAMLAVGVPMLLRVPTVAGVALSWVGLGLIVASGALLSGDTAFPGFAATLPVGGAALAVAGGTIARGGGAEALLRLAPLQWLGKLSYSWYLWHWPVLAIAAEASARALTWPQNLALAGIALALAAVTFSVWEEPIRRAPSLTRSVKLSLALGIVLVIGAATFCTFELVVHQLGTV